MSSSPRMKIRCPNCRRDGTARVELLDRKVACNYCSHIFRVAPVDDGEPDGAAPSTQELIPQPLESPDPVLSGQAHEEELRLLRGRLERARGEVEIEARKARKAIAATHDQAAEHAETIAKLERLRFDAEARRLAENATRAEAETARAAEDRTLRDDLIRARAELVEANEALGSLRLDAEQSARSLQDGLAQTGAELAEANRALAALRVDAEQSARVLQDQLTQARAELIEASKKLDGHSLDRDRLADELQAHRDRLAEADRLGLEHQEGSARLQLELDRLQAARSAEMTPLLEELEAARVTRLEREEALAERDRLIGELESARLAGLDVESARLERDAALAQLSEAEARRIADDSTRIEADAVRAAEDRVFRDDLARIRAELDQANETLGGLRLDGDQTARSLQDDLARTRAEFDEANSVLVALREEGVRSARVFQDDLMRARAELDEALAALAALRVDAEQSARVLQDQLTQARAELIEASKKLDGHSLDRDRLADELQAHRDRLAEADRLGLEHQEGSARLQLELDRLQAARSAEMTPLLEELEAARVTRLERDEALAERDRLIGELESARLAGLDVEAARLERDEALTDRDKLLDQLESLRSQVDERPDLSGHQSLGGVELEVIRSDPETPSEAEIPALGSGLYVGVDSSSLLENGNGRSDLNGFSGEQEAIAAAEALRRELERVRAEAEAVSRQNLELVDRLRAFDEPPPTVALSTIEADHQQAVDEVVKLARVEFERRLAGIQARLSSANVRADEIDLKEAQSDRSAIDEMPSLPDRRIPDSPEAAPLSVADAESRLFLARHMARDRQDKPLMDRISETAERIRGDIDVSNPALAESLVQGVEIEAGLDVGGYSVAGLPIFRPTPVMVAGLSALAPALDQAFRQGDLATIGTAIGEMKSILGNQAGLPEIRRIGRTPTTHRPIAEAEALRLFISALESESWLIRPIAAKRSLPETSLSTYAGLAEACCLARVSALKHAPDCLALLNSVIEASSLMLLQQQLPDGHFAFLDPRGKPSPMASVVDAMVVRRPDAVQGGWVVLVDPIGMTQVNTAAAGVALAAAGRALGRPAWSKAALKAADWAMGEPSLPHFVANAASIGLLARAYLEARREGYLLGLLERLERGLLPGQVDNGRWVDAASATTPSHLAILRGLHEAWKAIPAELESARLDLKSAIDRAMSSFLDEMQVLGVPPQGQGLRELIRHRELTDLAEDTRLGSAILDAATVVQELCQDGPKSRLAVAPDQLVALLRAGGGMSSTRMVETFMVAKRSFS